MRNPTPTRSRRSRRGRVLLAPIATVLLVVIAAPVRAGNLFVLDGLANEVKEFDATTGDFVGVFGETDTETTSVVVTDVSVGDS